MPIDFQQHQGIRILRVGPMQVIEIELMMNKGTLPFSRIEIRGSEEKGSVPFNVDLNRFL
jgi:hypothetical protein